MNLEHPASLDIKGYSYMQETQILNTAIRHFMQHTGLTIGKIADKNASLPENDWIIYQTILQIGIGG